MLNDLTIPVAAAERGATRSYVFLPFAVAGLSGLLFAAAFPPLSWPLAVWLGIAPLLVACSVLSPRRAALAGLCWTSAAAIGVAGFLPGMLSAYFGLGAVPSWMATLAIAGGLNGLFVSSYAAWVAWLVRRRAANPLLLAGGWVVCEYCRAHAPLGTPWALVASSQIAWTPLIQNADLAGPWLLSWLIAAVNASVAALFVPALRGRRPQLSAAFVVLSLVGTVLYGQWRLSETFGDGAEIGVAVVQGGATPQDRPLRAARQARYINLTRTGAARDARLIVWPEYATEAYLEEVSPARDALLHTTIESAAELILGAPHYEASAAGTRYHNSAYLVRDGRLAGRYDKRLLVPFAEDDRIARAFGAAPTGYVPGDGELVLPGTDLHMGALLCVETMFSAPARQAVQAGADLLVNLSNDAWFGDAAAARQQLDIAVLRAVETRRYLVRAAATGFSAVIDPHGRTLAQSQFNTFEVLNASVRAARARTPYQYWGDAFAWAVITAVVVATLRSVSGRGGTPQP